jgi:hypothetical protein
MKVNRMLKAMFGSLGLLCFAQISEIVGGKGTAEWTALAAICFIVVWLITKTLPSISAAQQRTIDSLMQQTETLRVTLQKLADVVTELGRQQIETRDVVAANLKIQDIQVRQVEATQSLISEIMKILVEANAMMKPVPELRAEQNHLLKEMLEAIRKKA